MLELEIGQKAIFYDIVINYFMNNPVLYDKMEENYILTVEKESKLKALSDYLKVLKIDVEVPQIIHAWQDLVKQFKKHLGDENNAGTGSGATENDFPYFQHLMFLKPAVQHRPSYSSILPVHGARLQQRSSATVTSGTSNVFTFSAVPPCDNTSHASPTEGSYIPPSYRMPPKNPAAAIAFTQPGNSCAGGSSLPLNYPATIGNYVMPPNYQPAAGSSWMPASGFMSPGNLFAGTSPFMPSNYPSAAAGTSFTPLNYQAAAGNLLTPPNYQAAAAAGYYSRPANDQSSVESSLVHHHNKAGPAMSKPLLSKRKPKVPNYDESAQKKMKFMTKDDKSIKNIENKMIETLDHINMQMGQPKAILKENTAENTGPRKSTIDYSKHLAAAFSQIPAGYEHVCMEYVLQELETLDKQDHVENVNPN